MASPTGDSTRTALSVGSSLRLDPLGDAGFAPGHLFASRYRIVSLLGRGAMGEVYRADDLRLGQIIALKLVTERIASRRDGLERLKHEVRLARTIAHPNVCRVYDIGHGDGRHYLTMEYVDGETLRSLLRRIGSLPAAKALAVARQLCAGLAAAHERGVLHRDLKPSNIMLDGHGQIRIMDFGLAVALADEVREIAGTPGYMAPEQQEGEAVTERSDIYALGRVLADVFAADARSEIQAVIQSCLAADPSDRPPSALAVAMALPGGSTTPWSDGPAVRSAPPPAAALSLRAAWILLAFVIAGSVAIAWRAHVFNIAPSQVPNPPEVLAERARAVLAAQGHTAPAVDRASWFWTPDVGSRIRFTYRESTALLVPTNLFRVVTANDPPEAAQRMVTLEADGTVAEGAAPVSRSVFATGRSAAAEAFLVACIFVGFIAGIIMTRQAIRAGAADLPGASRLASFVAAASILGAALRAHHVPSAVDEVVWLLSVAGWSLVWAAFTSLAYLSLRPYFRRWWPGALLSWERLLAGHLRDPRLGRDVLVGLLAGVVLTLALTIQLEGRQPPGEFVERALESLRAPALFGTIAVVAVLDSLNFSIGGAVMLVLLRLILRRTVLAAGALVVIASPLGPALTGPVDVLAALAFAATGCTVLLRFGILAHVMMFVVMRFTIWLPLTLDGDAWYFGRSLLVLLVIAGLAVYGFVVALAGKPAFGELAKSTP